MMKIINFQHAKNLRFLRMKKAQTEIMGLAIVVILVILGGTFAIRYILTRDPIDYKETFTQSELASNMLNTFLETDAECGYKMAEILRKCSQGSGTKCDGKSYCDYFQNAATAVFGETLEKWNMDYEFRVFHGNEPSNILSGLKLGTECPREKESKTFPIPTTSGTLSVRLDICS